MTPDTLGTAKTSVLKRPLRGRAQVTVFASRLGLPILLALFIATFSLLEPDTFATWANVKAILTTQSVLAVLALAALLTLLIGEFDLSLGAQLGLAALLIPGLTANGAMSIPVAVMIAVAVTTLIGVANGFMVAKLQINSFIATIGTAALISALVLGYSGGSVIFDGVPQSLLQISLFAPFGIPAPIIDVVVVAILAWILVQRTPFGRHMAAVGGSRDAARLSGIHTGRVTLITFGLAGMLSGLAGAIEAGQLGSGNPSVGPSFLLPAFAAAFLGATCFRVGQFNVWGTVTAVVTIATGVAGLNLLGMPQWVEPAFNGAALLIAVTLTRYLRGKPL